MLIFDLKGNRIGYGKGYYDRFLQECRQDVLKVGLTSNVPLDLIPGVEEHDMPLDYCIYPYGVLRFD